MIHTRGGSQYLRGGKKDRDGLPREFFGISKGGGVVARPKPHKTLTLEKEKLYGEQKMRGQLENMPKNGFEVAKNRPKTVKKIHCPGYFSEKEQKIWRDITAILKMYGLLIPANFILIELLTVAWHQYLNASEKMREDPFLVISGPNGGPMYNPNFTIQHRLGAIVEKYSQNLGLSSVALAKIGSIVMKGATKKDKDGFFDD